MTPHRALPRAADLDELYRVWAVPRGFIGWLSATDHKTVGVRFIVTAFIFFIAGGIEAAMIRAQLAQPELSLLGPEAYNQIFTMHGTTMMFFFAVPILEGIAVYFLPLVLGSRDVAFPRMNAFAYWTFLFAGLALYGGFFAGVGPDAGWFAYPPLSERLHSPTDGMDFWAMSITLLEFSALAQAITIVVTILKHRAPGMSISRMPLFAWSFLVFGLMIIFAMPTLVLATLMLELDRGAGTHFFNPAGGGDPLLWQHLFWWFAHPEVYIIFIPSVGIIASVLPAFVRRSVVGYPFVALSLVATGLLSFLVWAHHMFATGLPRLGLGFFSAATLAVAIPSGVQIFAWLATAWSSHRIHFKTPMLFSIGFIVIFVLGGLSGVTLASVPFDRQVHDTFYVVAHFHYVLVGGFVFPLFAGFYYWFPKVKGRLLSEPAGRVNFWLLFIGTNLTFFPMHIAGMLGMPRRIYTYPDALGWTLPNLLSSIGALLFALGVLVFIGNVIWSFSRGRLAGPNPWGANTLEWATTSPPPPYNFHAFPSVRSRDPLWAQPELGLGGSPAEAPLSPAGAAHARAPLPWQDDYPAHGPYTPSVYAMALEPAYGDPPGEDPMIVTGVRDDRRETLGTTILDAYPESRLRLTGPSYMPILAALGATVALIGAIVSIWYVAVGAVIGFVALARWHWPDFRGLREGADAPKDYHFAEETRDTEEPDPPPGSTPAMPPTQPGVLTVPPQSLPELLKGPQAPLWWAMLFFITIEIVFFFALVAAYFYLGSAAPMWPQGKIPEPDLAIPIAYTIVLCLSSLAMYLGDRSVEQGRQRQFIIYQAVALTLGFAFLGMKGYEYATQVDYTWYSNVYGSLSWTMSGFHAAHVLSVLMKGAVVLALGLRGWFTPERKLGLSVNGIYWHFVVVIWLPLFYALYIAPRFL
jgi:cytochrome c oxidase subunit I+III